MPSMPIYGLRFNSGNSAENLRPNYDAIRECGSSILAKWTPSIILDKWQQCSTVVQSMREGLVTSSVIFSLWVLRVNLASFSITSLIVGVFKQLAISRLPVIGSAVFFTLGSPSSIHCIRNQSLPRVLQFPNCWELMDLKS